MVSRIGIPPSITLLGLTFAVATISLIATIKAARPDLLMGVEIHGEPIPQEMPPSLTTRDKKASIEGIGEPTTACFMTRTSVDPTGWYAHGTRQLSSPASFLRALRWL